MSKRTTYEIKKKILACVNDKPLSMAELERKVNQAKGFAPHHQ